jgi:hypothetical protein
VKKTYRKLLRSFMASLVTAGFITSNHIPARAATAEQPLPGGKATLTCNSFGDRTAANYSLESSRGRMIFLNTNVSFDRAQAFEIKIIRPARIYQSRPIVTDTFSSQAALFGRADGLAVIRGILYYVKREIPRFTTRCSDPKLPRICRGGGGIVALYVLKPNTFYRVGFDEWIRPDGEFEATTDREGSATFVGKIPPNGSSDDPRYFYFNEGNTYDRIGLLSLLADCP